MGNRFRSLWESQALRLILAFTYLGLVLVFSGACGPDRGFDYPCIDNDGDGYGKLCNPGPDCDDGDENNWVSCAGCLDGDSDGYHAGCDAYTSIDGPDCDDGDVNNWESCETCLDGDSDTYYAGCDAYNSRPGPDECDDDANNWTAAG
ncbi:MAG: hypothetical protein JSU92_01695, partial [Deltaproteobacteria bacterium]